MVLNAEQWPFRVPETRYRPVIHMKVGDLAAKSRERLGIDAEPVVLAGDFDAIGEDIPDGLVGPSMAKFELVCLGA